MCALCDVTLTPVVTTSGARPSYIPPPKDPLADRPELRPLWLELTKTLAPQIRLVGILGEGGMGLVFIGVDETLRRDVAIKVLSPAVADDSVARARFRREAEAAAAVSHPNIVSVFQVGELPRSRIPYIVMQFVDGPTLGDAIGRVLPEARVRRIMAEIASALAAAHRRNVVHRDVKPPNIALDGETGRALVLDFGISAALSSRRQSSSMRITTGGMYLGTPTYMSPEQASADQVTPKSDVYSLGVLVYELLTGKPPFEGNPQQMMAAHVKDRPPRLLERRQDISPELVSLVERCLEKDPASRPTAQEIVNYLQPSAHALIEWPPPGTQRLRRAGAQLLAVALMIGAATLAFFVILGLQPALVTPAAVVGPSPVLDGGAAGAVTPSGVAAFRQHAAESAAVWSFLLGAGVVVLVLLTITLLYCAWTTISLARWARSAGYPWVVVWATATDQHRNTRDLRNTTGRFAVLNPSERDLVRRFRRGKALASILSLPAAVFSMAFWISGLPSRFSSGDQTLISSRDALLVCAPVVVCLLSALLLLVLEQLFIRRTLGTFRMPLSSRPVINPELVQSWMTTAGGGSVREPRLLPSRAVFVALLVALGAATALPAAAILTVVGETTARLIPARATAAEWVDMLQTDSLRPMTWREIDGRMAESAVRPESYIAGKTDDAIRAFVAAFVEPTRASADSAWLVNPHDARRLPTEPAPHANSIDEAARELRLSPGATTTDRIASDTISPRLSAFRGLAHVPTLSASWAFRPGIPGVESPFAIPVFRAAGLRRVGYANAASGLVALARGDTTVALLRARENVAVARQLTRQLDDMDASTAALLVLQASHLIRAVGVAKSQPVLTAEADHLEGVADELRRPVRLRYSTKALALFADPSNATGTRFFGDTTIAPSSRVGLVFAAIFGHCLNAREMLFGIDSSRLSLLDAGGVRLGDIARADEIAMVARRWVARWLDDQRGVASENVRSNFPVQNPSPLIQSLGWIGLGAVRDRMLVCRDLPL